MTTPDYDYAATKAYETLIKYQITSAPVAPLAIIKDIPGVVVVSFTELSARFGMNRDDLVTMFGDKNQDAVTTVRPIDNSLEYIITYNQQLPFYMLQRALARELGHIILHHDGSRPEEVRTEEAMCFARHLLCPRPVMKMIESAGIPLTVELVGGITGCYRRCLDGMRITPGAHVPAELNRLVKDQFSSYVRNFIRYAYTVKDEDMSERADFGTFMDNYEE